MTASPAHFQLFAWDGKTDIRWRVLSANNRELGRSYSAVRTAEECLAEIAVMVAALAELVTITRRREENLWQWTLLSGNRPVAMGGHAYDRQIRSQEAASRFRSQAASARVSDAIAHSGARRWVRPSLRLVN